jgi:TolB-like protein/class 3 adenylate cyclase/Flp pilus assembly protein TadD
MTGQDSDTGNEQRRLSAIMFTDMVGYSSLAQRNERLSLVLLQEQQAILRPLFGAFGGKEIEAIGDAFFVEFDSALGAARCAIEIQRKLRERNGSLPDDQRIRLRIGLHLGDVVHVGDRVHGDGVNIAARIEPLADPGGICVSEDFARQVENKLDEKLLLLGRPVLKNIRTPQCVYRIVLPWERPALSLLERARFLIRHRNRLRPVLILAFLAVVSLAAYLFAPTGTGDGAFPRNRIAVIPLTNISRDPDDEYFADGMTEELISELSMIRGLDVIARTSVMKYKGSSADVAEIGRSLGIGTVLEGSVRKASNKARISVKLVDVLTQKHLWSEEYDRELRDIFAIQSDIAHRVAEVLQIQLVQTEQLQIEKKGTENLEAYRLFLLGRHHLNKRTASDIEKSIGYLSEAVSLDPEYAQAYTTLADAYILAAAAGYDILPRPEATAHARQAVMKALDLDETLADAHTSLAYLRFRLDWNWTEAEREFLRAIELKPGSSRSHEWYALYLSVLGRREEALAEMKRAYNLDPLSPVVSTGVGRVLQLAHRYDEAVHQLRTTIAMDSLYADAHFILGMTYRLQGKYAEAIRELDTAHRLSGGRAVVYASLGMAYADAGRKAEAERVFNDIMRMWENGQVPVYYVALVHIGRREYDKAVEMLDRAYDEHEGLLIYMNAEPLVDPVRHLPRFKALLARIGFPQRPGT